MNSFSLTLEDTSGQLWTGVCEVFSESIRESLKIVGSRCGPIDKALELLELKDDMKPLNVEKYITKVFPLTQADEGIKFAAERSTMKVQIICSREEAGESDHSK